VFIPEREEVAGSCRAARVMYHVWDIRETLKTFWFRNLKEGDRFENLGVCRKITRRWTLWPAFSCLSTGLWAGSFGYGDEPSDSIKVDNLRTI
jgi:hypothetical protein